MLDWQNVTNWTVLVVDDEPDNREVVAETLEFHRVSVKTAANGVQGLALASDAMPTLILLDLSMPEMDGWQMRTRIKADPRTQHIPVIALSAHAMAGDKERALDAGFDGYLTKPINVPTLLDDLRIALQERRAELPAAHAVKDLPNAETAPSEPKPVSAPSPELPSDNGAGLTDAVQLIPAESGLTNQAAPTVNKPEPGSAQSESVKV